MNRLLIVGGSSPSGTPTETTSSLFVSIPVHFVLLIYGHVLSSRCLPRLRLSFSFAVILFFVGSSWRRLWVWEVCCKHEFSPWVQLAQASSRCSIGCSFYLGCSSAIMPLCTSMAQPSFTPTMGGVYQLLERPFLCTCLSECFQ